MDQYEWQGHHQGDQTDTETTAVDRLDGLMADDTSASAYDTETTSETVSEAASGHEADASDHDDDPEETPYSEPIPIPANVRNEVIFSERDVYRVLNSVIVLETCGEEMTRWLDLALSIGGSNIRRAITLVKMDPATFEDKAVIVDTLAAIGELASGGVDDPIQAVLGTISRVSDLDEAQKTAMVTLARRLVRDTGGKARVRGTKTAADVDIVKDIQAAMTADDSVAESVTELGRAMAALVDAAK